jgi:phage terminase Nu1 subunit (DNA packaging protein)
VLPKKLTKKELTGLLDISNTKLQELEKLGIITKNSTGNYDLSNVTDFVLYERYKIPEKVRLGDLASFLNRTERWIQQKTEDGIIVRAQRGEYEFIPSIKNYIESINNVFEEFEDENGEKKSVNLKELYVKKNIEYKDKQIEEKEIKLRKMRGELYEAADVEKVWSKLIEIFKAKLLGLPSKVAVKLEGETSNVIEEELENEVLEALEELMNVDPEEFKSKDLIDNDDEDEDNENSEITE